MVVVVVAGGAVVVVVVVGLVSLRLVAGAHVVMHVASTTSSALTTISESTKNTVESVGSDAILRIMDLLHLDDRLTMIILTPIDFVFRASRMANRFITCVPPQKVTTTRTWQASARAPANGENISMVALRKAAAKL